MEESGTIAIDSEIGEETSTVTLHQRYIYRGYLQVAACDLTKNVCEAFGGSELMRTGLRFIDL